MYEDIEHSYECIVCREEWSTFIDVDDYVDDVYVNDHICLHCHDTCMKAWDNKRNYEDQGVVEIMLYFVKRFYNKFLLSIRMK